MHQNLRKQLSTSGLVKNGILILLISIFFAQLSPGGISLEFQIDNWYLLRFVTNVLVATAFIFSIQILNNVFVQRSAGTFTVLFIPLLGAAVVVIALEIILRGLLLREMVDGVFFTFFLPVLMLFGFAINGYYMFRNSIAKGSILNEVEADSLPETIKYFHAKKGKESKQVEENKVAYFMIEHGIVYLITLNNERYTLTQSIETLENICNVKLFFRVNRQCIASRLAVDTFSPVSGRKMALNLKPDGAQHIISKAKVAPFKKWINSMSV